MPLYTLKGIVVRRTNFDETDRIISLYTKERGKLACIAKGARKPISRLSGPTEVLTCGKYQLAAGRNLDIISQVDVRHSFPRIHSDLSRVANAAYICEMVDKMTEDGEPNPEIFDLLLSSLYLLERENDPEKILHMFQLQFMGLLGYEPELEACLRCRGEVSSPIVLFSPSMGGVVCRQCAPVPKDAIGLPLQTVGIMRILSIANAPEVERLKVTRTAMNGIAKAMRWYVRYRSERELKSAAFLETLRAARH